MSLRRLRSIQLGALLVLVWCCVAERARADVAPPPRTEYLISVDGATVKIYLKDSGGAYDTPCKGSSGDYGVVRENVETKEVYLLSLHCGTDASKHEYIVDYCVPQGKYRYGLLNPLSCDSDYYITAEVTSTASCGGDPRKLPPKKHTGATPWDGKANTIPCDYDEPGCSIFTSADASVGLGVLLLLIVAWSRRGSKR